MANLRDQLLKAGLIDKKAKHLAEQAERQKAKAAKADARVAAELAAAEAEKLRRQQEEFEARRRADREREAARQVQLHELERMRRLESTIDRNEVSVREGRRRFYFRVGATGVGFLNVHARQARLLEDGELCIVRHPTDARPYKLMDDAGLAELRSIDADALLFHAPSWTPREEGEAASERESDAATERGSLLPGESTVVSLAQAPEAADEATASESGTSSSM